MSSDIRPKQLKLDDLFKYKQNVDLMTVKTYNTVLERIHKKVQTTSRQRINNDGCWFVVPEIMLGFPRYDVRLCIAYLVQELRTNGFEVRYTHPNLLFICWKHWVPEYVRAEIKRQTGVSIDGFGNELRKGADVADALCAKKTPTDTRFLPVSMYKPVGRFS